MGIPMTENDLLINICPDKKVDQMTLGSACWIGPLLCNVGPTHGSSPPACC